MKNLRVFLLLSCVTTLNAPGKNSTEFWSPDNHQVFFESTALQDETKDSPFPKESSRVLALFKKYKHHSHLDAI